VKVTLLEAKMNKKSKILATALITLSVFLSGISGSFAKDVKTNKSTARKVVAGTLSLLIWPGIGQAVNDAPGEKVLTHAVMGLLPPFRFWSCYDAVVDRKKGYWDGRI
jgi:hypothetical protein